MTTEEMARRYQAGETVDVIAAATGLHHTTVRRRIKRAGVEMTQGDLARRNQRLDLPGDELARRYRAGESAEHIGLSLGVSSQTVRNRLAEMGVERRRTRQGRANRPTERKAATSRVAPKRRAIEDLLRRPEAEGMTQVEIADACKVHQAYVSKIAKRLREADHGA
jgi:hypothetical protein